jgi:hypothetical protein
MKMPVLPEGYRYGEFCTLLTIECSHGSVSIDLKKRRYALGLTTHTPHTMLPYAQRGWKARLIQDALASLQNAHGFLKPPTNRSTEGHV